MKNVVWEKKKKIPFGFGCITFSEEVLSWGMQFLNIFYIVDVENKWSNLLRLRSWTKGSSAEFHQLTGRKIPKSPALLCRQEGAKSHVHFLRTGETKQRKKTTKLKLKLPKKLRHLRINYLLKSLHICHVSSSMYFCCLITGKCHLSCFIFLFIHCL